MRHLRSAPGGLAEVGLPRLLAAGVALWLAPALVGAALLVLGLAQTLAAPLLTSAKFTALPWLIALPVTAALLHRGWFGWLPAAALGAALGLLVSDLGIFGYAVPEGQFTNPAAIFAIIMLIALRAILGVWRPAAFYLPPAF